MSRNVGNYRLLGELGEGAMGTVFRALDVQLDREVALKSLRPELARRADIVERFREEARLQGRLESQNIVRLYNFLREGDEFFMVMEFVRGSTLSKVLAQNKRLSAVHAINIMVQALNGLGYAHKRNVIHRDVKPANIMIDEDGVAKVTDFGIARLLGSARMTKVGSIVGTLEYISPEAVLGKEATALSDIYSSGVVLYELLSGRLPFASDNEFALARAQVETEPPPLRQWVPDVPRALEDAVMKALKKNPAQRFATAEAMANALNACLPGASSEARQESTFFDRWFGPGKSVPNPPAQGTDVLTPTPEPNPAFALDERRRKAVSMINRRVDELIDAGNWQLAQWEVEESIKQYPGEPSLAELKSRIAREQRYYQDALDIARREARGLLEKNLPQVAWDSLAISTARYRDDPELKELLRRAEGELAKQKARSSEISDLEAKVAALQKTGHYQEAVTVIIEAVARLPNQPELTALLGQTVQAQREHEKSIAVGECLQEVSALRKSGDWDKAFAAIDVALKRYPGDTTLLELRESVQAEHVALLRAKEIEDILERVAALERDNHLDAAEKLVVGAVDRFPDEPMLRQRLVAIGAARKAARDRAVSDEAIAKAQALLAKKEWPAAIAVVNTALREAPDEPRLKAFRGEIDRARDRYRAEVQGAVDQGRKLIDGRRFEDAFVFLSGASGRYPGEAAVADILLEAQRKLAAERRERQLDEAAGKADELLVRSEFVQAEEFLLDFISRFPDDPRLTTRLSSAINGRREQEKERAIEQGLKHTSELADQDRLEDAVRELDKLLSQFPSEGRAEQRRQELTGRLREQRRARSLAELRARAEKEARASRFDATLQEVAAALREYPGDPEFLALQQAVERGKRAFLVAKAEADAASQCADLEGRGEFDKALAAVDAAIGLYPEGASLPALRKEIEQRRQLALRLKKADDAEREARQLAASGDPVAALNKVATARAEFPEHAGLSALEPEIRTAVRTFEAKETERELKAAIKDRRWDSAEAAIKAFELKHGAKEAVRFRNGLQSARHERQGVLDTASSGARARIGKADFIGAIGLIESLRLEGPEVAAFDDLLNQARKGLEGQAFERSFQELRDLVALALEDGEIELARTMVADAGKKFEGYAPFVDLEARVRKELGLAAAMDQASRHLAAREWAEAMQCLDAAAAEFGSDRRISDLATEVRRKQQEHAAAVDAALAEARAFVASAKYREAVQTLTQAIERLPGVPPLQEALSQATAQARGAELNWALASARSLLAAGELEQAETLLKKALQNFPEESVLAGLLADVQETQRRREVIQGHTNRVRDDLTFGEPERAEAALLGALREFPDALALLDLRCKVASALARRHLSANRFEEARRLADEAIQKYGDDGRLTKLIQDIDGAARRKAELDRLLAETSALLDEGESEAALDKLDHFPDWARDRSEAVELRARCSRMIAWRTAEFLRIKTKAEQLIKQGQFEDAVNSIETASREKQLQKLLQPLLERARSMRDAARQVASVRAVLEKEGPTRTLQMIDDLGPDALQNPDLRILRDRCERMRAEPERVPAPPTRITPMTPVPELAPKPVPTARVPESPKPPAASRLWLQYGSGAAALALAAGLWIATRPSHTPPPPNASPAAESIDRAPAAPKASTIDSPYSPAPVSTPVVQPAGTLRVSTVPLRVDYQIGKTFPASRTIPVTSTGGPVPFSASVIEGQGWLLVSPESGRTPGSLTVSFRIAGLSTGTHTGSIRCEAEAGKSFTIPVELNIRAGF